MSEIRKSIDALKRLNQELPMNDDGDEYSDALVFALAALHEKEERESGCEFCNEEYAVMSGSRMTQNGTHKGCTAKFCPTCGRKLKVRGDQHE